MKLKLSDLIPIGGLILAMAWNVPHLVHVYADITGVEETPYHYMMMVIIEFSVLVFALKAYDFAAQTFAWIIFLLNIFYYFESSPLEFTWEYGWYAIFKTTLAAIPAYLIAYYSDMFSDIFGPNWINDKNALESSRKELGEIRDQLDNNRSWIALNRPAIDSIKEFIGQKIIISNTKATICKCGCLVKAGSNSQRSIVCSCGKLIEWDKLKIGHE